MVAALVSGASYLYISQILQQGITTSHDTAAYLTSQLAYLATNAAPDLSSTRVDTGNPDALRRGIAYYLGTDRDLNTMLESVVGSWPTIYDAAILDPDGKAILDTDPNLVGQKIAARPDSKAPARVPCARIAPGRLGGIGSGFGLRRIPPAPEAEHHGSRRTTRRKRCPEPGITK